MNHTNANTKEEMAWDACPAGSIRAAARVSKMSRRSMLFKIAAVTAVAGGGIYARMFSADSTCVPETSVKRWDCEAVAEKLNCFIAGKIDVRDNIAAIKNHLQKCPSCKREYEKRLYNAEV